MEASFEPPTAFRPGVNSRVQCKSHLLLGLNKSCARGTVADDLDDDFPVLCPDEMRLFRRFSPDAAGRKRLHLAFIELLPEAHVQRARDHGSDAIVRVKMRLVPPICKEPGVVHVHPRPPVIPSHIGSVGARWRGSPSQVLRSQPGRLQYPALCKGTR